MATFSLPIIRKEPAGCEIVSVALGYDSILRLAAECARVVHEVPDLFVRLRVSEARHSGQTDSMLDDPEKFSIGPFLHLRRT